MASAQLRPPYIQNNLISVCLISEMHCIGKVLLYETTKPDKEMTRIHLFLWPRMSTMPYNIFHLDTFPFYENRTGTGSYTDNTVEIEYMFLGYGQISYMVNCLVVPTEALYSINARI